MARFIATVMLQDVNDDKIYNELDQEIVNEDGYPYITGEDDKIYALPPDMYEFEANISSKQLLGILTLICTTIEKKYNLKKTPIVVSEVDEIEYSNLEELRDEDFQDLN